MTNASWPLFDLRICTPRLKLRLPTDDDLASLADVAAGGVHDARWMPFLQPWSRLEAPQLQRNTLQYHWRMRADWTPEKWSAQFVVVADGDVVGMQGMEGEAFAKRRVVSTGSWLGLRFQGRGYGKEMRAAALHLAFAELGADVALTAAREDNVASLAVTRALGYEPNGTEPRLFGDQVATELLFRLTREGWEQSVRDRYPITITGLDGCRDMFGV